jgi:hypothetical protein
MALWENIGRIADAGTTRQDQFSIRIDVDVKASFNE